jgi:hypothetical protein
VGSNKSTQKIQREKMNGVEMDGVSQTCNERPARVKRNTPIFSQLRQAEGVSFREFNNALGVMTIVSQFCWCSDVAESGEDFTSAKSQDPSRNDIPGTGVQETR